DRAGLAGAGAAEVSRAGADRSVSIAAAGRLLMLRPLGDRILIQPDQVKTQTESGLHLVEDWPDEVSGIVVAVGKPRHPRKDEAFQLADELTWHHEGDGPRAGPPARAA